MNRTRRTIVPIVLASLSLSSCVSTRQAPEQDEMIPFGPDVRADLVVYFKTGVTEEQIEYFWENVLSQPGPNGRGHYLRDGVRGILKLHPFEGHEGLAVTFHEAATPGRREDVTQDIESMPIVYKVLVNVAPEDVKKLD